jgi:response regulator of citrate/malate metabolism
MVDSIMLTVTTSQDFLSLLRQELHNQVGSGSRMIVAATIEEACALLEMVRPRLVVVDWTGVSGRYDQLDELLWATTVVARRVPVLVIADRYRTDQATMLFRMGVTEYVSRTHHQDQLGQVFSAYLPLLPKLAEPSAADTAPVDEPAKTRSATRKVPAAVSQARQAR